MTALFFLFLAYFNISTTVYAVIIKHSKVTTGTWNQPSLVLLFIITELVFHLLFFLLIRNRKKRSRMSFDEQIINEKERMQLNKYNINKEMDINTTRMSRCRILLIKIIQLLFLSQKTGWEFAVSMRGAQNPEMFPNVYQGQNQDQFI